MTSHYPDTPRTEHPNVHLVRVERRELLDIQTTSALLGISPYTLHNWNRVGRGAILPVGRWVKGSKLYFHINDIRRVVGLSPLYKEYHHAFVKEEDRHSGELVAG